MECKYACRSAEHFSRRTFLHGAAGALGALSFGGMVEANKIHDFCQANGIPVWCGGMLESGVGRAYNVAIASLPNFTLPGDVSPSARYWARDIVSPEWTMDQGMVHVPLDRPGIGRSDPRGRAVVEGHCSASRM